MLFRAALVLVFLSATGCVSLRDATLISTQVSVETFNAPVKCGPVGFRRVPLEARFGEYVRVTVASPVPLKGSVFVHADGIAQEPTEWRSSAESPLVVEARFENDDPDKLVLLNQDRPIDITITGLEAAEGGSCEGAVFTLEHGRLLPPVGEAAWLAELERRGGPELIARRAALAQLEEERRLAHYAEWSAKDVNAYSEEELALMEQRRLAHYAAWDAEHSPLVEEEDDVAIASADEWNAYDGSQSAVVAAACASGACEGAPAAAVGSASASTDMCPGGACGSRAELVLPAGCGSMSCAVPASQCSGACVSVNIACPGGVCTDELVLPAGCGAISCAVPRDECSGDCVAVTTACPGGVCSVRSESAALGGAVAASSSANRALVLPAGCGSMACAVPESECDGVCIAVSLACPGGVCGELMLPIGCDSISCAVPKAACGGNCTAASAALALPAGCGSMNCAVPVASCGGNCTPAATACPGGVCGELSLPVGCGSMACAVPASSCTGGCTAARVACPNGVCAELMMPPGCTSSACAVPATVCRGGCTPCGGAVATETWSTYPPASGGGGNMAGGGVAGRAEDWAMPQTTTEVAWEQYPTSRPAPMPPPRPCQTCGAEAEVDLALDLGFLVPAMFGIVFGPPPPVVVGPPRPMPMPPRPAQRPHGAVPVRR